MSLKLLGEDFDLHTGGLDLKFPHHENERAQAQAAHRRFARHWAHHGWVMVGEEKMSKSLGNFTSLTDLLAQTDARAYRLLVLRSHYRSPIEVSPATIADAERALARLDALARRFDLRPSPASASRPTRGTGAARPPRCARAWARRSTRTSTRRARWPRSSRRSAPPTPPPTGASPRAPRAWRGRSTSSSGRSDSALRARGDEVDPASAALVAARDAARAARDWAGADRIRAELEARGWTVEDGADGTVVRR